MAQIVATIAVTAVVLALLAYGLVWLWHYIKRYRLAVGFAALTAGFAIIRFISLHEVDAWFAAMPGVQPIIDTVSAAGASALAIYRFWQLRT